jgi:type IV secretory pathway VirD2 relaxase
MKTDSYHSGADDDGAFKIRLKKGRKPSSGGGENKGALSFFRSVQRVCRFAGGSARGAFSGGGSPHRNQKGKGVFTRNGWQTSQRVVVKTRVVRHPLGAKSLKAMKLHLGYLTRSGVEKEGPERSRCYDENGPLEKRELDLRAEETARDRHHFRFIVSPEKGRELDLTQYASELVREMEKDLGTRLDYLAVNHYNTDNPHVHLIVRGRNEQGKDLVIGRDYLSRGVRNRAQEIATSWLGHRSELEIQDGLVAEIELQRFTGIDRELLCLQGKNLEKCLDLRNPEGHENSIAEFHRSVRKQRVRELEKLGLAREVGPGVWRLNEETERVLRELGIQKDIIKTMHKSLGREADRELVIYDPGDPLQQEVSGRVLDRGVRNELSDEKYLVLSASDNRAYYVGLSRFSELEGSEAAVGSQVSISVKPHELTPRISDGNILELARGNGGIYDQREHLERTGRQLLPPGVTPEAYLENHLKRLRVLKRNGLVQQLEAGRWRVPADLPERMQTLSREKGLKHEVQVRMEPPARVLERGPGLEKKLKQELDRSR